MPASPFLSTISRDIPILPDRAALLFIDGQNFSCHPDGAEWRGMSPEERAEKKDPFLRQLREDLFPKMQALQRAARAAGVEVMYTTTERLTKDGRNRCLGAALLPAKNIVPPGFFGHVDDLEADPYDPDQARALLAQTSYGEGFRMTIHGPNDRYINDARTIEAIAQFWTQVGVTTEVDTMPRNIYFSDLIRGGADAFPGFDGPKFSMSLTGWGTVAGEATHTVSGILETYNAATRGGNGDFGR